MKPRRVRFRLAGRFNGAASATIEITQFGEVALFSVRPFRSRRVYELPLTAVARGVIYDVVRKDNPIRAGALRAHEQPKNGARTK
jgi:hypothetical protein